MRIFLVLLALLMVSRAVAQREDIFGYRDVVGKAEALSKQPFAAQIQDISPDLQNFDYDLYRRIRFLPEKSVWKTLPCRLGFFHPGYYFKRRVIFHNIEKDRVRDIPFSPDYFYYDKPIPFTGHETFVGFKAFVPSVQLNGPEEFPDFREFWMREPSSGDDYLEFYALLDSESVTWRVRVCRALWHNYDQGCQSDSLYSKEARGAGSRPFDHHVLFRQQYRE